VDRKGRLGGHARARDEPGRPVRQGHSRGIPTKINMRPIGGGTNTDNTSVLSAGENFHVTWVSN